MPARDPDPTTQGGWLEVVCGPMFSGKSEEMIRRLRRAEIAGAAGRDLQAAHRRPLRRRGRRQSRGRAHARRAGRLGGGARGPCARPRRGRHRRGAVLRAGDRGGRARARRGRGAWSRPGSTRTSGGCRSARCRLLLAHAEFVDKLQAVCHRCGGPATTTQRLVDGRPAPYSGDTVVIGAAEQYEARCRDCHEPGGRAAGAVAASRRAARAFGTGQSPFPTKLPASSGRSPSGRRRRPSPPTSCRR